MPGNHIRRRVVHLLVLTSSLNCACAIAESNSAALNETVNRALRLLPRQPDKVVVVDMDDMTSLLREKLRHADAFVTHGERTVYLKRQGDAFQHAMRKSGVFDYVLAIAIWHEMAHIDGADEREAQRQEEELWMRYILEQRVDTAAGQRYLALLRKRR
jgi:hypothetical protein